MSDNKAGPGQAAPWYLWAVVGFAILWNGYGVILWGGTTFMADAFLSALPAPQRDYVMGLPSWSTFTWGLGVLGGVGGSILLAMRNRLAVPAFALSLVGAVVNTMVYITNPPPEGFFSLPLTLFIIGFAAFQLWFAYFVKARGVLA
ncbi:MAG: hypothetical protein SGJ03_00735 [Alphaproteobacteria bacterium]|nr:hypothetical protein [Alphaproteobacteria bacterium]